jgi:putative CocE/NonD family hydrolase
MFKKLVCLAALASISHIAVAQTAPHPSSDIVPSGVIIEKNVAMKTRDGVTLRADVYRPGGEGPFPVLLVRTPYNKDGFSTFGPKGVKHGFMVVAQDVRGRYESEGEWYPFKHETDDGYDAVEWAAALPYSNGKVGMFSGSYVGATQMLAAIGHPPHLAGICPIVTASNYHENWTYQGGAFEQWFNESWTSSLAQNTAFRQHDTRDLTPASNALIGDSVLPLRNYPLFNLGNAKADAALTAQLAPYFLDWLAHPTYDSYWRKWSIEENFQNIQVPALTIAAWYDIFLEGSLRNYIGLRDHAGNPAARANQRLVVAIGGHSGWGRKVGDVDFGPDAPFDENEMVLEWYDYLFLGKQNQFADAAHPVKVFVMGKNEWRSLSAWPPPEAKATPWFLASDGRANSSNGDGLIFGSAGIMPLAGLRADTVPDHFTYDPANPVPTVGGPLCCDPMHLRGGPRDQKEVEARPDVLVYSTNWLEKDVNVTGPVTLELYASSSAVDTDFTAKLVDVSPDGFARNVTEGILRASFRDSNTKPKLVVPGRIYRLTIDMAATSNVFLKGHKIRLEISSSNFPRFDRNLNTGKSAAESTDFVKATQTIYHDFPAHPSALILPIIP